MRSRSSRIIGERVKIPTFLKCGTSGAVRALRVSRITRCLRSSGWKGSVIVPITSRASVIAILWYRRLRLILPLSFLTGLPLASLMISQPSGILISFLWSSLGSLSFT